MLNFSVNSANDIIFALDICSFLLSKDSLVYYVSYCVDFSPLMDEKDNYLILLEIPSKLLTVRKGVMPTFYLTLK